MKKVLYHKLVRDRIPQIIAESGTQSSVRQVHDEELRSYAFKKLREEVQEFIEDPCAEEAGDILEVLEFICVRAGLRLSTIHAERMSKRIEKGSFNMGFVLEWTEK